MTLHADSPAASLAPTRLAGCLGGGTHHPRIDGTRVIGVLPGEGIGPEVVNASLSLLPVITACTGQRFELRTGGPIGTEAERLAGQPLTPEVVDFCRDVFAAGGAVFCGPGGGRFVYELRTRLDLYCKLVPLKPLAALHDCGPLRPEATRGVDLLIVRENLGGLYQGESGGDVAGSGSTAWQRFGYSQDQVDRILRVAIAAARLRRGHLAVVTKPSGIPAISALWESRARELTAGTGVTLRCLEVDNAAYQLVADAHRFDVVVAPNMFGDVLADGASVLLGSRGMSYSANFADPQTAVYQTGHGAAYDLAGLDRANPVGQILSLAMLLRESFGLDGISDDLVAAVDDTLAEGWRTPDIASRHHGPVGTRELAARIAGHLKARLAAAGPQPAAAVAGRAG